MEGRTWFTGPGPFQTELGLSKHFMTSGSFGNITDTRVPPRIVPLGPKLHF